MHAYAYVTRSDELAIATCRAICKFLMICIIQTLEIYLDADLLA
jgi:hypothetical protein